MGSAVGQVPEYVEMVTRWCKANTSMPVIVKLTPNVTDIKHPARAAQQGGADAVSLINTVNSVMGVDLDVMAPEPSCRWQGHSWRILRPCGQTHSPSHGLRYCKGSAMQRVCRFPPLAALPPWRDAAEFIAMGAGNVQVCTAAMTYGFKIIDELTSGLANWMDEKGHTTTESFKGQAVPNVTDWQFLNLNYVVKAKIHQELCIQCGRCHIACEDTSHQAITSMVDGVRKFEVIDEECVGCNLCVNVCPVEGCITLEQMTSGVDPRTGTKIDNAYANWTTHPNNPQSQAAE